MSVVVIGTVAYDTIITETSRAEEVLGGSATYFSLAASFFSKVKIIGNIGEDFLQEHINIFIERKIDTEGLRRIYDYKTFRWKGKYSSDFNEALTLETHLNVLEYADILVPDSYKNSNILFLANIDPEIQLKILSEIKKAKIVAADTMNYWIKNKFTSLRKLLKKVHLLCINEGEARQLSQESNVVKAAKIILRMGPSILIIKRGGYGAILFYNDHIRCVPAFPLEEIVDPTGAGDSFAGAFLGYLDRKRDLSIENLTKALAYGNVTASFTVEDFSINKLISISRKDIENRYKMFREMVKVNG